MEIQLGMVGTGIILWIIVALIIIISFIRYKRK